MRPITLAACLGLALVSRAAVAADPTAAELAALAPTIRSGDKAIRTIDVSGYYRKEGRLQYTFRALYEAPGRFAFATYDGASGTPISFSTGRELLIYEPEKPRLIATSGLAGYWYLGLSDGKYEQTSGFRIGGRAEAESIVLDLKSLFSTPKGPNPDDVRVVKDGPRQYSLISRRGRAFFRAHVDLTRPRPFTALESAITASGEPGFRIDRIAIDSDLPDSAFRFPVVPEMPAGLPVRRVEAPSPLDLAEILGAYVGAFRERAEATDPTDGPGLISPRLRAARRKRVADHDGKYAAAIQALVPLAPEPREFYVAMPGDDADAVQRTGLEAIRDRLPHLPVKIRFDRKKGEEKAPAPPAANAETPAGRAP